MTEWKTAEGGRAGDVEYRVMDRLILGDEEPVALRLLHRGPVLHDMLGMVSLTRRQAAEIWPLMKDYSEGKA